MQRVLAVGLSTAAALLGAACDSTHHAATKSTQGQLQAKRHVEFDPSVESRDGRMVAVIRHVGEAAYLDVGLASDGERRTIHFWPNGGSPQFNQIEWASPNLIVFEDGGGEVRTVDVRTRRVHDLATATDFNVSRDGRWVGWWRDGGEFAPANPAGIVSISGKECLLVPTPKSAGEMGVYFPDGDARRVNFLRYFNEGTNPGGPMSLPLSHLRRVPPSGCLAY